MSEQYAKFHKTFSLSVPVERAWQAFTEPKDIEAWLTGKIEEADVKPGGRIAWAPDDFGQLVWEIVDAQPPNRLTYREGPGILPVSTEVTVTLEQEDTGTKVTVTQAGFGEGEDWAAHIENVGLGWWQTMATLDLYLRTGVVYDRFFTFTSGIGVVTEEQLAGPVVASVFPDSYGTKTGLQAGDIIVKLGAAPVFTRSDIWMFTREHAMGEQVEVTYVRDGELRTATAELSEPS